MRLLLLSFGALALLNATGCGADGGCITDSQCRVGRICVQNQCIPDDGRRFTEGAENSEIGSNSPGSGANNDGSPNIANNGNNANNVARACDGRVDCADGDVCTALEPMGDVRQCVEPWACERPDLEWTGRGCVAAFHCNGGDEYTIYCDGDPPQIDCHCEADVPTEDVEFTIDQRDCTPEAMVNAANLNCGWRVQLRGL